jgi:hypothetical protein
MTLALLCRNWPSYALDLQGLMLFVQIKDRITFDNLGNPDCQEGWLLDLR